MTDHINPKHYKIVPQEAYEEYPEGLEYFDLMQFLLDHHKPLDALALGQVFKYLMRAGTVSYTHLTLPTNREV